MNDIRARLSTALEQYRSKLIHDIENAVDKHRRLIETCEQMLNDLYAASPEAGMAPCEVDYLGEECIVTFEQSARLIGIAVKQLWNHATIETVATEFWRVTVELPKIDDEPPYKLVFLLG